MKQDLILLGAGGHCKSCIDVIEQQNKYNIIGILDIPKMLGSKILGYDIIGNDEDLLKFSRTIRNYLITVGQIKTPKKRIELFNLIKGLNLRLPVIVSPLAYLAKNTRIGMGSVIMHHVLVNTGAVIGENCIVNSKALIEHDAVIGDHCHISTAAIINGGVNVGCGCFIGSNAVTRQYIKIPGNTFIQANSFVNV